MKRLFFLLFKGLLFLVLPFIILIRGSVYIHENYEYLPYISLLGGIIITALLLLIYFTIFYSFVFKRIGSGETLKRTALAAFLIVGGYCIHGLFFISSNNMKSSSLSKELTDLHPILRIAVSTIIILDKDLIITDASRVPEDYRKMGLRTKSSSLHYKQKDGYAYALDLRTSSRTEIRNILLRTYFWMMGFNTIRHGGTGDHLHISLDCHYRPGAI
jgi:hypothetical protein